MKKWSLWSRLVSMMCCVMFAVVLSACSLQKEKGIKSIEIIEESVPEFIVIGEFDKAGLKALITYDDDTTEIIDVNSQLLKDNHKQCVNSAGQCNIEILFKGKVVELSVKVIDAEEVHVVKFFNGFNELVSLQIVEDGKSADAPEGKSHLIDGYEFLGWDRAFNKVQEDMDIYGIYAKTNNPGSSINYHSILMAAADKMRVQFLNILDVWQLASKRIEMTQKYDDRQLVEIVKKEIDSDRSVTYFKYLKEINEGKVKYTRGEVRGPVYISIDISEEEFIQNDIYGYVKKIVSSTDNLTYSTLHTVDEQFYKLVVDVPNKGDGGHDSDLYEFLFNEEQIISLKRFTINKSSAGEQEKTLVWTKYYSLDEQEIIFPLDADLADILQNVYSYDVVITKEEMRDILFINEIIKNDSDNKAAVIDKEGLETYMWDKDNNYTYYTKESLDLNESIVSIYKTNDSLKRYGNEYYYLWKDLSSKEFEFCIDDKGASVFSFRVEQTSLMREYILEFIVFENKLIGIDKYYYNQNQRIYIERESFLYQEVEVQVPELLLNNEGKALEE